MSTPIRASDRDLRALAAIVSQDREDPPAGDGLPPSLLADLMGQIGCDNVVLMGFDASRQALWFLQVFPPVDPPFDVADMHRVYSPGTWASPREPCAPAWKTSTRS
jgi:hypothetical protein